MLATIFDIKAFRIAETALVIKSIGHWSLSSPKDGKTESSEKKKKSLGHWSISIENISLLP